MSIYTLWWCFKPHGVFPSMQRPESSHREDFSLCYLREPTYYSASTQAPMCPNSTPSLGQSSLLLSREGYFVALPFLLEILICLYREWKRGIEMEKQSTVGKAKKTADYWQ